MKRFPNSILTTQAACLSLLLCFATPAIAVEKTKGTLAPVSFRHDVRPVLSNHCFACHGPDEAHREADARLDVEGEMDSEEIIARITSSDPEVIMPPPELNKPLSNFQINSLKRWVDAGAPYEQHWAFTALTSPKIPSVQTNAWSQQPLDQFVIAELERQKLSPSSPAAKRTLIRRLCLDLTGLPPTREQIKEFLTDESTAAYEMLVQRLVDQPAYGEHMARYWLDLVRFADTNGLHHDHYREMTLYRDWVIRSFNKNMPFDQFITSQLAGDLFPNPTNDQLIASGFHRLHLIIDRGTALPEESEFRNVVDRVSSVGTAFMGLTMQCAVCHDHKFDPITQKDFYRLSAFFNNFDGAPETGGRGTVEFRRGLQPPYLELPTPEQSAQRKQLEEELAKLQSRLATLKQNQKVSKKEVDRLKPAPAEKNDSVDGVLEDVARTLARQANVSLVQAVQRITEKRNQIQAQYDGLLMEIPAALVMKERSDVRITHVMVRGAYDQPGAEVQRGTPGFLPPMSASGPQKTRMDLANWFTDAKHPLTARVAVNRIWQQFFGVGLVRTSEDFGSQGETPSHPELLDFLAVQFTQSGWNVKDLVRLIVRSKTYQQSSHAAPKDFVDDPQNRLLSRGSRFRLDAEVVRDQWLSASGLLTSKLYGKSVKPPQPPGLWKIVAMPSSFPSQFTVDSGDDIFRRSVYTFWKRGLPPPQMTVFDAPTRESCIARRERTNTPLQALLLMNEEQHFAAAKHLAKKLLHNIELSDRQRIEAAYETIVSQLPNPKVLTRLTDALSQFRLSYQSDEKLAQQLTLDETDLDANQRSELAAWTMLVHSLFNLDATRTRE